MELCPALNLPPRGMPSHAKAPRSPSNNLNFTCVSYCEFVNILKKIVSVFCLIGAFCGMKIEIMTTLLTKNKQVPDGGRP